MGDVSRVERRLKLHDMRVLMSVIEAGSMVKAAERLGTSQPAVSRSISELEHALGVRLLDRGPRGIEPTPYGVALVKRGAAAFDELNQGIKDIELLSDPTVGSVRIGASIAVSVGFVSAVIERLTRRYPRLSFDVLAADTGTACRYLEERKVDLAIVHMVEPIPEELMSAEILFCEPQVVATGVQSPWTRRRRVTLAELIEERWTLPPPDTRFGALVAEAFRANGLDVPRTVVTASLPVRNVLAATGQFLTMTPRVVLTLSAKNLGLQTLPIDLPTTRRPVAVITLRNRALSPVAQMFVQCAREASKPLAEKRQC
jgi:DNA-binding transcriptional LysR family regulator